MKPEDFFGPSAPFFDDNGNPMVRQEGERLLKNDLIQLIMTGIGERVMRPFFGTELRTTPMDQMDDLGISMIEDSIREGITTNDSRFIVKELKITQDPDTNKLNVYLVAALRDEMENDLVIRIGNK